MSTSRPWSIAEIEEKVPVAVDRLNVAVAELKDLGTRAAMSRWDYEKTWALCIIAAAGQGRNREEREAVAVQLLAERLDEAGFHPGQRKDLSENAYSDQRKVIDAVRAELDVMRTLMVSARGADGG